MNVFKFGGASVNSIERTRNVSTIIKSYPQEKLLIVISAMGKTTNALEKIVDAFYAGNKTEALSRFEEIKESHLSTVNSLVVLTKKEATEALLNFFTEVEWLLHDKPVKEYDYYYDQIVCVGELLSTSIVSSFLNEQGLTNTWIDVRDILRTDNNFRDANIDWDYTHKQVDKVIQPLFSSGNIIITQGFIGSTDENESTTLGREGSDYTAAIFANMLNASALTIWKDVEGVMNADPKEFNDAQFIATLNFDEVIEMAYYGAQVIHPKTIKPLQNKNIPFYVKCFLHPQLPGTLISSITVRDLPPIIVIKRNQVLMQLNSKDFSFVSETLVSRLYEIFAQIKIRPNLTQNAAISMICCLDDVPEKIEKLALAASEMFEVQIEKNLELLTVRHYTQTLIEQLTAGKTIELEQKTTNTIQVLMK
jgi:aspartate kinase